MRFMLYASLVVAITVLVNCSEFATDAPEVELVGDFAPLAIGNEWVYEFDSLASSSMLGSGRHSFITLRLISVEHVADTIKYTFSVKDSGDLLYGFWADPVSSGSIYDRCTVTVSEINTVFSSITFCNGYVEKLFIAHRLPANKITQVGGELEYIGLSEKGANGKRDVKTMYRAGTGFVYRNEEYTAFGGGSQISRYYLRITLLSFNGDSVRIDSEGM